MPTTQLIIVAHAPLATALRAVAAHVLGEAASSVQAAAWLDVSASESPSAILQKITQASAGRPTLILTDVPHATPHNGAQSAANQCVGTVVVSHCTVGMVLRALGNTQLSPQDLSVKLQNV